MMYDVQAFAQAVRVVPRALRQQLLDIDPQWRQRCQEVRLQMGAPVGLFMGQGLYFLGPDSRVLPRPHPDGPVARSEVIQGTVKTACEYSLYSYQREIAQGFVTIQGGHRIGLAGKYIQTAAGEHSMQEFSAVNIRIARGDIPLCQEVPAFYRRYGMGSTLVVGPPGSGKTTLLRGIIRWLCGGQERYYKVAVIDERGEIANCFYGQPQNDLGASAFVFSYFDKVRGLEQAVRTMSPDIAICDEIGSQQDILPLQRCAVSGVQVIATAHGRDLEDLQRNPVLRDLLRQGYFQRILQVEPGSFAVTGRFLEGVS